MDASVSAPLPSPARQYQRARLPLAALLPLILLLISANVIVRTRPNVEAGESPSVSTQLGQIPGLPGMRIAPIIAGLTAGGLTCAGPSDGGTGQLWTCQAVGQTTERVEVRGISATDITSIRVRLTSGSQAPDAALLALVSTPYDGADPELAASWLRQEFTSGGMTTIGPATFNVSHIAGASVLTIIAAEVP